jgi:hypothetical protein
MSALFISYRRLPAGRFSSSAPRILSRFVVAIAASLPLIHPLVSPVLVTEDSVRCEYSRPPPRLKAAPGHAALPIPFVVSWLNVFFSAAAAFSPGVYSVSPPARLPTMTHPTKFIAPNDLKTDAVVPQCLDNQYVSDAVFAHLLKHRDHDYDTPDVHTMRKQAVQNEFIRSLVYSSQVVINRAAFWNNDFLHANCLPESPGFQSFCDLLDNQVIVPFLFNESSLSELPDKGVRPNGKRAIHALLEKSGKIRYTRLASDDTANQKATREMAGKFWDGLARLRRLEDPERNAMASELFQSALPNLHQSGGWKIFGDSLDALALLAFEKRSISRTDVYEKFLVAAGRGQDAVEHGRFRNPDHENPFVLQIKKLVDLIYNTNLPDRLNRHTFTPVGLPSRTALQDEASLREEAQHLAVVDRLCEDDNFNQFIADSLVKHTQDAMSLPLLSDLSLADVLELRSTTEWAAFSKSQQDLLAVPTAYQTLFEPLQNNFAAFQGRISQWYYQKYERARTQKKYVSFVTWALSAGGKLVAAGLGQQHPILKATVGFVPDMVPDKLKGYAAKLMVCVYDVGEHRLDKQRSYSVEMMRTAKQLTQQDVQERVQRIKEKSRSVDVDSGEPAADQGKA